MPIAGDDFDRQLYVNGYYAGLPVPYADAAMGIFPVKVLYPSELAWAIAQGNDGGMMLAHYRSVCRRGDGDLPGEGALPERARLGDRAG